MSVGATLDSLLSHPAELNVPSVEPGPYLATARESPQAYLDEIDRRIGTVDRDPSLQDVGRTALEVALYSKAATAIGGRASASVLAHAYRVLEPLVYPVSELLFRRDDRLREGLVTIAEVAASRDPIDDFVEAFNVVSGPLGVVGDRTALPLALEHQGPYWRSDPPLHPDLYVVLNGYLLEVAPQLPRLTAGVRPVALCVSERTDEYWVAEFGYVSSSGDAGTVPRGPDNVASGAEDAFPPVAFRSGRSAGAVFAVPFAPEDVAVWTLLGETAVATTSTRRCGGGPLDPGVLPATVVVLSEAGVAASFSGSSFAISGHPHALSGQRVTGPPSLHAIAVLDEASRTTVLDEVSGSQAERIDGSGAAPDVTVSDLGMDIGAWVDDLLARVDTLLGDRSSGVVGAPETPRVAYASESLRLSGGFQGYGVLVVDGAFEMVGQAQWSGLVVVRGASTQQVAPDVVGGARLLGSLILIGDEDPVPFTLSGRASVLYSPEALDLARIAASPLD